MGDAKRRPADDAKRYTAKDYVKAFGDRGGRWFVEGKSFPECVAADGRRRRARHKARMAAKDEQIAGLRAAAGLPAVAARADGTDRVAAGIKFRARQVVRDGADPAARRARAAAAGYVGARFFMDRLGWSYSGLLSTGPKPSFWVGLEPYWRRADAKAFCKALRK